MNFFDRYLIIMVNYVNIDFLSHCYRKRRQGLVDHTANGSQRVILANPRFEIDVTEQRP